MERLTLAAYSALTIADLLLFILALTILAKCIKEESFNGTFKLSIGMALWSGAQFVDRAWWTAWKANYISRKASAWMINHEIALLAPLAMTTGILLVILSLTQESPYKRFFSICFGAVFCAFFGAWVVK